MSSGAPPATQHDDAYRRAVAEHRAGRLAPAKAAYQSILAREPDHPGALHMLGVLRESEGDHEESLRLIGRAIALRPAVPAFHNNLGNALRELGRLADAEAAYRRALALRRDYAGALFNLANVLALQDRLDEAAPRAEQAVALDPARPAFALGLATIRRRQGRAGEAEALQRRALALDADNPDALCALAELLRQQGRVDEAVDCLQRALRRAPGDPAALNNLGSLLELRGEARTAAACLDRALARAPHLAPALFNRGRLHEDAGELVAARDCYERALASGAALGPQIECHLGFVARKLCDWTDEERRRDGLLRAVESYVAARPEYGLPPLTLNALGVPAPLRRAAVSHMAALLERHWAETRARCGFEHAARAGDRLRIGYVSPDLRQHAVGTLVAALFEHHDRAACSVHAYSLVDVDDAVSRRIRAGCDAFADVSRLAPEAIARRIHADGIDVLVDLAGHTTYSRPAIFALRPAPVQVHWMGYLDTMGAPFLPYVIADAIAVTPGMAADFSEAVVTLPENFSAASPLPVAVTDRRRADERLPEDGFVFCSMSALYKIDPAVFEVWMRILRRVPGSVLWLADGPEAACRDNLRREAEQRGVDAGRLVFAPWVAFEPYLARYALADLFLDTFAYNAGATAIGALQSGLPVLTCPGDRFLSRMGASHCAAAGLPELICGDAAAYEERAVALATRPGELADLRDRLRATRARAPLFDTPRLARHLEHAFRAMWEQHRSGTAPAPIRVSSID